MLNLLKGELKTKSMQNHVRDKCLIKIYKQKDFCFLISTVIIMKSANM